MEKPGCLATAAQAAGTLGGGGGRSPPCLSVSWFLPLPLSFDRLSPSVSLRVSLCLCAPPPSLSPSVLFPDPPVHTLRQVQITYWAPGPRAGNTMTSSTPPRGSLCLSPLADEKAEAGSHQVTRPHKLGPPVLGCRREDQGWETEAQRRAVADWRSHSSEPPAGRGEGPACPAPCLAPEKPRKSQEVFGKEAAGLTRWAVANAPSLILPACSLFWG